MITQLKAFELAETVCKSYNIRLPRIYVHAMMENQRGKIQTTFSVSASSFTTTGKKIKIESALCNSLELAVRNFELSAAKEMGVDYQRCAEFYINYES